MLQDPDQGLALGQPRAERPGPPTFTTVVKPRPSGQYLAVLSDVARLGAPPSSDLETATRCPPGPAAAAAAGGPGTRALESRPRTGLAAPGRFLMAELGGGEGLFPCSICSVKFVKCKESLNSCIFKREKSYLTLLCSRFTYTHSLEPSFSFNIVKILKESCNFILFSPAEKKNHIMLILIQFFKIQL